MSPPNVLILNIRSIRMSKGPEKPSFAKIKDISQEKVPEGGSRSRSRRRMLSRTINGNTQNVTALNESSQMNISGLANRTEMMNSGHSEKPKSPLFRNQNSRGGEAMREIVKMKNKILEAERKIQGPRELSPVNQKPLKNPQARLQNIYNELEMANVDFRRQAKEMAESYTKRLNGLDETVCATDHMPQFQPVSVPIFPNMSRLERQLERMELQFQARLTQLQR